EVVAHRAPVVAEALGLPPVVAPRRVGRVGRAGLDAEAERSCRGHGARFLLWFTLSRLSARDARHAPSLAAWCRLTLRARRSPCARWCGCRCGARSGCRC